MEMNNCKKYSRKIWLLWVFINSLVLFFSYPIHSFDLEFFIYLFTGTPFIFSFGIMFSTPLYIVFHLGNEYLFFNIKKERNLKILINIYTIFLFVFPILFLIIDNVSSDVIFYSLFITCILSIGVWGFKIERVEIRKNVSMPYDILDDIDFEK